MSYYKIDERWHDEEDGGKEIRTHVGKDGITYRTGTDYDVVPVDALPFRSAADCAEESPKEWLIDGVIALREDSSWWGPSGGLKSNLLTEISVCIAAGRDWRGHRFSRNELPNRDPDANPNSDESRGVIIFATERAALTRRRIAAYVKRENLPADIPLAVVDATINLMDPTCVNQVSDTIFQFEQVHDCSVGLVVFDTWSKCLGGHDETLAHVQNYAAAQTKKIRERHNCYYHTASVGHSGKSIEAGERGSSARRAHVDFAVKIYGEGKVKTAKVDKANDGEEGVVLATFEAEEFTFKRPDWTQTLRDGREYVHTYAPLTVGILAPYDPDQEARAARTAASRPPTGKQAQAIEALQRAIAARGQGGAVHPEYWKEELSKAGLLNLNAKNPRSAFKKLRDSLGQRIIEANGLVRINTEILPLGQIPPPPYPSSVPMSPS
jgi:hypothetical protein